jgi:hypothetical protein
VPPAGLEPVTPALRMGSLTAENGHFVAKNGLGGNSGGNFSKPINEMGATEPIRDEANDKRRSELNQIGYRNP